jgi:hypothetical protein
MYVQQMKMIQIIHAHMYVDKSHVKIHIQLLVFLSKFWKFHILYIIHIIYQLPLHLEFICGLDRLYSGVGWTMSRNK